MIMKVITLTIAALFAFTTLTLANNDKEAGVDVSKSSVEWYATKVTGKHNGTVQLKDASIEMADGKLSGGSFTVDMTSIAVTDLQGEMQGKLEGHLKSDDFFGVESHPEATFQISEVAMNDNGSYAVSGDMTIKGHSHPVAFTVSMEDNMAKAEITLDRTNYDVRYGSKKWFPNIGDKMIHDEFKLVIALALTDA